MEDALKREKAAIEAIDHGFHHDDRTSDDWRTIAIVHALLAVAEAIDRQTQQA